MKIAGFKINKKKRQIVHNLEFQLRLKAKKRIKKTVQPKQNLHSKFRKNEKHIPTGIKYDTESGVSARHGIFRKKFISSENRHFSNPGIGSERIQIEQADKGVENKGKSRKKIKTSDLEETSISKTDSVKIYMREIGNIPLVSRMEEVELAAKIHGKDEKLKNDARDVLIKSNLRLVVKIAHDFKGIGLPLQDLIAEGNIGLMRAVEKFDPAKGAKFSSYAAWWIKQSMRRALGNQCRTIRVPIQSAGKMNKIKAVRMKLAEEFGRAPTDLEIAVNSNLSERTVAGLRCSDLRTFSLQDPIQQGEDGELQEIIPDKNTLPPDEIVGSIDSISRLNDLFVLLDDREKIILKMRFGLYGYNTNTLEEVSRKIGRTRERVRQIQNQALTKLKSMMRDEIACNQ